MPVSLITTITITSVIINSIIMTMTTSIRIITYIMLFVLG